ncbi:MAG: LTA synthase family protein [Cyclobacteriaceae bacterium]|nr:LTA synthase family protein [Cyclobacteriaceae bacterium]
MRQRFKILLRLAIFWMAVMIVARICFLVYNADLTAQLLWTDILKAMLYGLRMDMSMTGYILLLSGLILVVSVFTQRPWIAYVLNSFNILMLAALCVAVVTDLELYHHWGFRLNTTPLFYMSSEAAGSAGKGVIITLVLILLALLTVFIFGYMRIVARPVSKLNPTTRKAAIPLFIVTALMFIPIRGGFSVATMNAGQVYFHKTNNFANHAGINVLWNFLSSLQSDVNLQYPEDYFDRGLTETYFKSLYPANDSTVSVLKTKRPNVILIIVEGFTANVIESLGGRKGITPNFNTLSKEGILFTNFYASGDRTDKGLVSILSGFPAQTQRSIIKFPDKTQKLPYISRKLESLGYKTSFVYGGDADFANYRSFFTYGGFRHITSVDDFDSDYNTSKWGVHDQYLFEQAEKELDTTSLNKPFFKAMLTLSSHEPFDVPLKQIPGDDDASLFLNSCYYTDKSIGDFISYCKKQPWWDNTLIIITADHGHRLPDKIDSRIREKFHTPMLWLGGAIKKDTVITRYGGQTDIANTLLAQLDKPSPDFLFSKDLFGNNTKNFAMYIFIDGYGYLDPEHYIVYDNPGKLYLHQTGVTKEEDTYPARAYVQKLFLDYNSKK